MMNIACTLAPGRGDTDLLLQSVARTLRAEGYRGCGLVQINSKAETAGPCDMDVQVLPDGPVIRISQDLGRQSRGCRLDSEALETAVGHVATSLADSADFLAGFLIVNKFGKHEAEGRGFRPVIADALALGIPVLVGLNALNRPAFDAFCDGMAHEIEPHPQRLAAWLRNAIHQNRHAA